MTSMKTPASKYFLWVISSKSTKYAVWVFTTLSHNYGGEFLRPRSRNMPRVFSVVPCQIIHIIKYNYPFITPFIRFSVYVGMDGMDKSSLQINKCLKSDLKKRKTRESSAKLIIKTPIQRQSRRSGIFNANFKYMWHWSLVFPLLTLRKMFAELSKLW